MRIDIVADVICPWCFIGKRRLDRALAQRPDIVAERVWHAFQLNPQMPQEGVSRELYLAARFGSARNAARVLAAVREAGRGEGIAFALDKPRHIPNTMRAHRLVRLAAAERVPGDLVDTLYRAYFERGLDIGDLEVLAGVAAGIGLDAAAAARYLAGDEGRAEVEAEDRRARHLGIHAVPCFILGGDYVISGAQEPELFLPLFDLAAGGTLAAEA
jgi:predicted DsbA family dithiol-disulfide isomerase